MILDPILFRDLGRRVWASVGALRAVGFDKIHISALITFGLRSSDPASTGRTSGIATFTEGGILRAAGRVARTLCVWLVQ